MLVKRSPYSVLVWAAALLLLPPALPALYSAGDNVLMLNPKTFKSEVLDTEHAVLVEFFAPWCGHCKALAPEYKTAARNLTGIVKFASVDCDVQANDPLCKRYGVKGYPTVKLFPGASSKPDKHGKFANKKIPEDYQGPRTAKAIIKYAVTKVPSFVVDVSSKAGSKKDGLGIDEFLGNELPKVLLFSEKAATPLYKALSVDFHYSMIFGKAWQSDKDLTTNFNVAKSPSLLVFPKGENSPTVYDGQINHKSLFKFFKKFATPATAAKTEGKASTESKEKAKPTPKSDSFDPTIPQIATQDELQSSCLDRAGICVLVFSELEPEYEDSVQKHNKTLNLLSTVKRSFHGPAINSPFRFYWIESLSETRLPDDFRLTVNRPTLMALNSQRLAYRPFTGAFDEEGVKRWLKDIIGGRGRSFSYDFEPKMTVAATAQGDKAAAAAAVKNAEAEEEEKAESKRDEL